MCDCGLVSRCAFEERWWCASLLTKIEVASARCLKDVGGLIHKNNRVVCHFLMIFIN